LKLYNTLTRHKDELQPLDGQTVRMYTCGLTVYSQPHIGNWVGYIYWDVLVRLLRWQDIPVVRTQNITDVGHLTSDDDDGEDKMEKGARREGVIPSGRRSLISNNIIHYIVNTVNAYAVANRGVGLWL